MEKDITNLIDNSDGDGGTLSEIAENVEDIIARGALEALNTEPEAGTVTVTEAGPRTRRKRRTKKEPEPTAEEAQINADLATFFSPEGIGKVWVTGVNGFYLACNAALLSPEEESAHANVFATYMKRRMPASSSKYQPELLLLGLTAMTTLPRIKPIAVTTAPTWKRAFAFLLSPFRRKKAVS